MQKLKLVIFLFSILGTFCFLSGSQKKSGKKIKLEKELLAKTLEKTPPEIWMLIIHEACGVTDSTIAELSLVSKQFREIILPESGGLLLKIAWIQSCGVNKSVVLRRSEKTGSYDLQFKKFTEKSKRRKEQFLNVLHKLKNLEIPLDLIIYNAKESTFSFRELKKIHTLYPKTFFTVTQSQYYKGQYSLLHLLIRHYVVKSKDRGKILETIKSVCANLKLYVNYPDDKGYTPLHCAFFGDSMLRNLLIKCGANQNAPNNKGQVPSSDLLNQRFVL